MDGIERSAGAASLPDFGQKREIGQNRPVPRHPVWVRTTHWLGAASLVGLAVSGTAILLALPRLFWGETGANDAPAWLTLPLPINLEQTGWGRNVHFLSAWIFVLNGFIYLTLAALTGRLFSRLLPTREQVRPTAIIADIRQHLAMRRQSEPPPSRYNVMQKLAYLAVLVVLAPVMVLSGLTMSPGVTAAYPELFWLFGGRQSARTIHFLAAVGLVLFFLVHVWQVLINNPGRLLREMTVGAGRTRTEKAS